MSLNLEKGKGLGGDRLEGTHRHCFLIVSLFAFCPQPSFPKSCSPQSLHPPSPQLLKPKTWALSFAFPCWERQPSEACPTPARLHESGLGPGTLPRKDMTGPHSLCWTLSSLGPLVPCAGLDVYFFVPLKRVPHGTCPPPTAISVPGKEG